MTNLKKSLRIVLCICTANRPNMLISCLDSVCKQVIPENWDFQILVVNNSPWASIDHIINSAKLKTGITINWINESQQGIPFARNTACTEALRRHADWILMIDDDEEALPDWMLAYENARIKFKEKVFTGPVNYIYPDGYKEWLENKGKSKLTSGRLVRRASTNNVFFSIQLLTPPLSLDFDTQMAFTGGSDSDFFMRYVDSGGKIVVVSNAVVSEIVLPNRLTIFWRMQRQFRSSSNRVYIYIKLYGKKRTFIICIKEIPMRFAHGILRLISSPFYLLGGYVHFKKSYYHGLRHLAKGAGAVAGLIGRYPQPYKKLDGY